MDHCAGCGWPARREGGEARLRCEACGDDLSRSDAAPRSPRVARDRPSSTRAVSDPEIAEAEDAWQAGDYPRLVGLCLVAEGGTAPRTSTAASGPAWSFLLRGRQVSIVLQSAQGLLSIETPVARLPARQRVAAMRAALRLSGGEGLAARLSLRHELLLVRVVARAAEMAPRTLRRTIRDAVALATRAAAGLEAAFDALPPELEDARDAAPQVLTKLAPPPPRRPESLLPPSIPPVLSPAFAVAGEGAPPTLLRPGMRRTTLNDLAFEGGLEQVPGQGERRSSFPGPGAVVDLCDLLDLARTLAAALSATPAGASQHAGTLMSIVRATLFRAALEFRQTSPDAVAKLWHAAYPTVRSFSHPSPIRGRRDSLDLTLADPALRVMDEIVACRGLVPPEAPIAVEPITSAAEARAQIKRYSELILAAPPDRALRHFLALGALSELLVRTKLPAATDQRLREIVAHARRDSQKSASIDLMLKTLQRIAGA